MAIHRFLVNVSDGSYNFINTQQLETMDMRTGSYGVGGVSGERIYTYRDLGLQLHENDNSASYMNNFTSCMYDDEEGTSGDSSILVKVLNTLNSFKCKRGTTRIIWFGGIDSSKTKHIPRIEIVTTVSTYTYFSLSFKIDNTTYFSTSMVGQFHLRFIPWINMERNAIVYPGETVHYYYPPIPPSQQDPDGTPAHTQITAWAGTTEALSATAIQWFDIAEEKDIYTDPYGANGESTTQESNGNYSDASDMVTDDGLPEIDAVGTGFATLFSPTKTQLKGLADVFWSQNVFAALQNLVQNLQDMFTSLGIVPFQVETGSSPEVTWLGLPITSIYLRLCTKQYYEFEMGSIDLSNDTRIFTSDTCLDYSPFSKIGIFLPFIGFEELDIDEVRGTSLSLKYKIDVLSGACVAIISVSGRAIYQFTGNCLTQIPITNINMQSLVSDAVNVGIAMAASKTAGAASSADVAAIDSSDKMSNAQKEAHKQHARIMQSNADNHLMSATANAMMGLKPQYNKSGAVSSAASLLAVKQPYLFLTTPRMATPRNYGRYGGYPTYVTGTLSSFSGFTVVEGIRLNNLVATTPEVEEIYELLRKGVII